MGIFYIFRDHLDYHVNAEPGATNILPRWFLYKAPVFLGAQSRILLWQVARLRCPGVQLRAVFGRILESSVLGA